MSSFGENLKRIRESNNMRQSRLAELMGITQQRISKWECGKVEPTLQSILNILKVLDTSFEELTDGIEV